jgi:hypothetical protein
VLFVARWALRVIFTRADTSHRALGLRSAFKLTKVPGSVFPSLNAGGWKGKGADINPCLAAFSPD